MEYTACALVSAAAVVVLDRVLGTRLLGRKDFWLSLGVMGAGMLAVNGYLTWRPVVLYAETMYAGVRLGTIPLEDFLFGFSLVALSILIWEHWKRRARP